MLAKMQKGHLKCALDYKLLVWLFLIGIIAATPAYFWLFKVGMKLI